MIDPETIIDGRYKVLTRLGSGGMADVYLAEDQLLGRQVAVKVLHHHFAEDQEFVERFRREASSAAGLSHPNIVGIFDRGEWNGTYYIAMEYVAGRSLKTIVREQGPLDPATAIDIVIQILRAARFAHKRGVIHRDVKPHNVILDEEGRARVTDFGIARAGASEMTLTGSIMGTAQYLSPEQAQGHLVSAASDLYAIGVVLYELLTGVVPFEGETAVAIAFKQVSAEPRPPSALNPALPAELDAVVLRAMAKDPAERFADADEFIVALEHARRTLPAGASRPPLGNGPVAPAVASAALLLPPAGRFDGDYDPDSLAGSRDRRRRRLLWGVAVAIVIALAVLAAFLLLSPATRVTVPDVTGQTEQAAVARLRRAGLTPALSLAANAKVASGLVLSEAPPHGSVVARGARVSLVVSSGPGIAALPNVKGMTSARAVQRLTQAGFKPSVQSQSSATVGQGVVISTEPSAGAEAQAGSPVTVLVSSGPAQVHVPDVTGQSLPAAEAALTTAGLSAGTVTKQAAAEQSPGTVLTQSPSAGSSLPAGGKVNLTVAQVPKEATVPSVLGQNEAQAAAALGSAGFTPKTASRTTLEASQVGVVLKQVPAAGRKARKGATVTITVGVLGPQTTPTTTTTTTPPPAPTG
jgi:beta-lactam-binding protein with PASTA domain/predicted Ser/Thr protein kinase